MQEDQHYNSVAQDQDIVSALQQVATVVQTGPKLSQKARKQQGKWPPPLARAQIKAIAQKINKGELSLPELDLPHDSDYVAIWALVDSGSSVHVANVSKVFPGARIEKPPKDAMGLHWSLRHHHPPTRGQPLRRSKARRVTKGLVFGKKTR